MRYIAIRPDEQRAIHWTKVSIDTFVSGIAIFRMPWDAYWYRRDCSAPLIWVWEADR
jgi:hypothetical protein